MFLHPTHTPDHGFLGELFSYHTQISLQINLIGLIFSSQRNKETQKRKALKVDKCILHLNYATILSIENSRQYCLP